MEKVQNIKLIIDSFSYAKIYLEMNKCLYCDENNCENCIIDQALRHLEIFEKQQLKMIGGK